MTMGFLKRLVENFFEIAARGYLGLADFAEELRLGCIRRAVDC